LGEDQYDYLLRRAALLRVVAHHLADLKLAHFLQPDKFRDPFGVLLQRLGNFPAEVVDYQGDGINDEQR